MIPKIQRKTKMQKELKYHDYSESFIKKQWEAYQGQGLSIYKEEFSTEFDAALQQGASPLVKSIEACPSLQTYGVIGLKDKILELNAEAISAFTLKHNLSLTPEEFSEILFQDFQQKYVKAKREYQLFTLIFASHLEAPELSLTRSAYIENAPEEFKYQVIFYEKADSWSGKNQIYILRERRIPVKHEYKQTERPDFLVYINGIPLLLIEYKTEDSGLQAGVQDFEYKESYQCAPFKAVINDGKNVLLFSNVQSLKLKESRNNAFEWVHFGEKKYIQDREYSNEEYFLDELVCQPQNLYAYCLDGCSVVSNGDNSYLVNARIQQYYAIKQIKQVLNLATSKQVSVPFNYEFAHAQRSGKTITMKLICYMLAKQFQHLYQDVFIYTPDLQIKTVLTNEFYKSGSSQVSVVVVDSCQQYKNIIREIANRTRPASSFKVYIVNMQKIEDELSLLKLRIPSDRILNIIDEAHHGQVGELAEIRRAIFPNASNFLFTATGKAGMYSQYFPDNQAKGFRSQFTISDARRCGITVPVHFLQADKSVKFSAKLEKFAKEIETRLNTDHQALAAIYDVEDNSSPSNTHNAKIAQELLHQLNKDCMPAKLSYVCAFMSEISPTLSFSPKAIIYVDSVATAREYIEIIQRTSGKKDNVYEGYKFGVDFAELDKQHELCAKLNAGLSFSQIESAFQRLEEKGQRTPSTIDILVAVNKYQKGFDLPELMVTFLDTPIQELSRINQIYTRTATKRPGKQVGYCVDLCLKSKNQERYRESMALYDNQDEKDCFLDDSLLEDIKKALVNSFSALSTSLQLKKEEFSSYAILDKVLNENNEEVRKQRQTLFFKTSTSIIAALRKLGSPLYYKPFAFELKALFESFHEFKTIYGDKQHVEYSKILINMDTSWEDSAYLTSAEIRAVIRDVLKFIDEHDVASVVGLEYVVGSHTQISEHSNTIANRQRQEQKINELKQQFSNLGGSLKDVNRPLFEQIQALLKKIVDNRLLVHTPDVSQEVDNIQNKLRAFKLSLKQLIADDFEGNALLYWLTASCNAVFNDNELNAPEFANFVARQLEKTLKLVIPHVEGKGFTTYEKADLVACQLTTGQGAVRCIETFMHFFGDVVESPSKSSLIAQLKVISKVEPPKVYFMTDKDCFHKYVKKALISYYNYLYEIV